MTGGGATELILIRHAPALAEGRLCGRTDVPADCSDRSLLAAVARSVGTWDRLITSPALRCRQTAEALWNGPVEVVQDLREQDFGRWDGMPYAEVPDLGPLSTAALARSRPPDGESFAELCARVTPALGALSGGGRIAVVAHAGTIRAALAMALGAPEAGLCFVVDPLSVTRIRSSVDGHWSILAVNWKPE